MASYLVWIDMLRGDSLDSARRAAHPLRADRLLHFYDPRRRIGKAIAPNLSAGHAVVWDVYLVFPMGIRWEVSAPSPEDWAHQLDATWADVSRFRWDEDLEDWLQRVTKRPRG